MAALSNIHKRRLEMIRRPGPDAGPMRTDGMRGWGGGQASGMVMRTRRFEMRGRGFAAHLLAMATTNRNGRVSLAEAEAAALDRFDRSDLNHDGKITPEERREAHERMRRERQPD